MKLPLTLLTAFLAITGMSSADEAWVYAFDANARSPTSHATDISPETVRSILAQRLGCSRSRRLGDIDDVALKQLNRFGGRQSSLLGIDDGSEWTSKLLIIWEGLDHRRDPPSQLDVNPSSIRLSNPPQDLANDRFISDALSQNPSNPGGKHICSYDLDIGSILRGSLQFIKPISKPCPKIEEVIPRTEFDNTESKSAGLHRLSQLLRQNIASWAGRGGTAVLRLSLIENQKKLDTSSHQLATEVLRDSFFYLNILASTASQETTILLVPTPTIPKKKSSSLLKPRQQLPEEPLSQPLPSTSTSTSTPASHLHQSAAKPPSNFLPICHATNASCQTATSNCSGHGICILKFSTHDPDSSAASTDCYACKCRRTVIRAGSDGESAKTVQWGGTACQKKDVSMPFWLLAGFSVVLVAAVSWGVGLLWSIGEEELPSVIGAGVAGPRAK